MIFIQEPFIVIALFLLFSLSRFPGFFDLFFLLIISFLLLFVGFFLNFFLLFCGFIRRFFLGFGNLIVIFPPFLALLISMRFKVGFALRPIFRLFDFMGGKLLVVLVHFGFQLFGVKDIRPSLVKSFTICLAYIVYRIGGGISYLTHMLYAVVRCLFYCLFIRIYNINGGVIIVIKRTELVGKLFK